MLYKRKIVSLIKNSIGVTTKRKLVAFHVDDWGSVRTRDTKALDYLRKKGLAIGSERFSRYDTLANKQDLLELFTILRSVKDCNGNHVCFTAVTNPCNPNFEAMKKNGYAEFVSEPFIDTLIKYGYNDVFELWKEGIRENIFYPIFHGTEHVSRQRLLTALQNGNLPDIWAFECESVGVPGSLEGVMTPYWMNSSKENVELTENIKQGLDEFERIFGFRANQFRAGGDVISPDLYPVLKDHGIKYMDETLYIKRYLGDGRYRTMINILGKKNRFGQKNIIRNCVFEPTNNLTFDSVGNCLLMIDVAFKCRKPAIISSHRVNYVGSLDVNNRKQSLLRLAKLLNEIVKRYPDVEFVNADQLGDII